jgi:(1->4)-alpha-D-glucan 1-alpha-D-glucosylmutase
VRTARGLADGIRAEELDALTEYFLWQTLVGAWPITGERLNAYALKAIRESKLHTRWTSPNGAYEAAVERFVSGVVDSGAVREHVEAWLAGTTAETRANTLGQKLVQLTMPGVPDVYQGTDLVDLSLVDPDNRRLVDYSLRAERLAALDGGAAPSDLSDEKLLVTSSALRVRRDEPDAFVGPTATYEPLDASTEHVVGFARGTTGRPQVVTLVTRLAGRLADAGGWGEATVDLPEGRWHDALSGRSTGGGRVRVAQVLPDGGLPVALLLREA